MCGLFLWLLDSLHVLLRQWSCSHVAKVKHTCGHRDLLFAFAPWMCINLDSSCELITGTIILMGYFYLRSIICPECVLLEKAGIILCLQSYTNIYNCGQQGCLN